MADLENRVSHLETKVSVIETKVDAFIQEMRDFKTEMRDRDNQRAAEIRELREQREKDAAKREAVANELRKEIQEGIKNIQNLTIAAIVGIVAIGVGVLGFVFTRNSEPQTQPPPAQTQSVQNPRETAQE